MIKKFLVVVSIIIILIISIFGIKVFIENIKWKNFENRVVEFYNGNKIPIDEQFSEYNYRWLEYAKTEVPQEYDISDAIKEYYNRIELAIKKLLNDKLYIRYDTYYKEGGLDEVSIHGIIDNRVEYICNNISETDIQDYQEGAYFDKLKIKLENIFIHKSNDTYSDWYIKNDKDKRIELPYNVYCDYKYNGKKLKNQVKKINSIKISKNLPCVCDVEYVNYDNNVIKTTIKMVTASRGNSNKVIYALPSLRELFYTNDTKPELTFGQHDYDEAEKKEMDELDALIAERAKLGLELTPKINWDDYDEDGNYIREESTISKEIYDWAVADLQKKALEFKDKGVKASISEIDTKIFESEETHHYSFDEYGSDEYLTDEDKEVIDNNLRIQREMVEKLWNKAKESLNEAK